MARCPELEPIAPRVWLLRGGLTGSMNAYLIDDGDGAVVYDTGEKGMAGAIATAAERMGGLNQVVLGHADTDHRGAAPALSALAPVVCHPDAVADAQGAGGRAHWDMSKLPLAVRVAHRCLHRWVWDGGPVQISGTVREGDEIAVEGSAAQAELQHRRETGTPIHGRRDLQGVVARMGGELSHGRARSAPRGRRAEPTAPDGCGT